MIVQLGASKTDQDGTRGRRVSIPAGRRPATCPIRAVRRWLAARGDWQGPLFCRCNRSGELLRKGIGGSTVNLRLKHLLSLHGENPAAYGAHSLRAGMITASAENGADIAVIMQRTGQRSVQTVMRYIRPVAPFKADPLKGVL
jgi:integrase